MAYQRIRKVSNLVWRLGEYNLDLVGIRLRCCVCKREWLVRARPSGAMPNNYRKCPNRRCGWDHGRPIYEIPSGQPVRMNRRGRIVQVEEKQTDGAEIHKPETDTAFKHEEK